MPVGEATSEEVGKHVARGKELANCIIAIVRMAWMGVVRFGSDKRAVRALAKSFQSSSVRRDGSMPSS